MSTIYIVSDYGKLIKKNKTLQLTSNDGTTTIIFPYKTDQLVVMGSIEITGPALKLLMRYNIDTVFLGKNGKYNGKIAFQESKNVFLRQKQFKMLEDRDFVLDFSKSVVRAKLKNQLTFMQRIHRRRENAKQLHKTILNMKLNLERVEEAGSAEQLRGIEGLGARYFFSLFRENIIQDWAVFKGRSMHPPEDNVNAVLSFLYTLLFFRVDGAIESEGLDSFVGYFHSLDYGKRTLSFDLMEEFRTPLADTLCCSLFNLAILEENDFEEVVFSVDDIDYPLEDDGEEEKGEGSVLYQEKKGVLLTKKGLRKALKQFEKKLEDQYYYQPLKRQISYKKLIREQVKHFKRVLNGEEKMYKPMVIK
ncbi:MAG: CRISPR-associated endonuclease Cas1 [Spirochaetes bacterium]|nr:MAG: CRISPR-associated endonuclease Cas1 [Spirochaetota bacterium]